MVRLAWRSTARSASKRHGHEPIIFAAVGPVDPELEAEGIRTICLGQSDLLGNRSPLAAAAQGLWNRTAALALTQLLTSLPSDRTVIHVHGWAKALSPSIAGPIAASGLGAVYTMHEYSLLCPNGGFFNYRTQQACTLDPLSASCLKTDCDSRSYSRKLWRSLRHVVMERIAGMPAIFSDIIAISDFQLGAVGHRLPGGVRIHQVSNPIRVPRLGP